MFGGNQKNVFGESSFGQSKSGLFGASAKGDSSPKQSSGLFGMPPIPDIGQPLVPTKVARLTTDTPVLFGKPVTNAPAPATGLFGSTTKPSSTSASQDTFKSVTFSNPFSNSSPAGVSPQNIFKLTPAVQASNTSSNDSVPPKSSVFSSFSAAPSQPAKIFGGSSAPAVDTPDLFKNVGGATTKPTTSTRTPISRSAFGNPFSSTSSTPQPVFGIKSDKGRFFGGEPTAKKATHTDPVTTGNIFGAKTSENRIFAQAVKQSGAVIPLFGKPSTTSSAKIDTSVPPPPVFKTIQTRLGKRPLGGAPEPQDKTAAQDALAKRRISPLPNYFDESPVVDAPLEVDINRRLFPETEIEQSFSIVCKQVPKQALVSKKILEKHFSKFGNVIKVVVSPAKETAIVHFDTHESAKKAKENGFTITPKLPDIGAIFYGKLGRKPSGPPTDQEPQIDVSQPPPPVQPQPKQQQHHQPLPPLRPKYDSQELINLTKMQALSDGDKFNILDARDKLIRLQGPAHQGNVLVGTCPDMCPEKERYSRSDKNQLRSYEKIDGKVHHAAVLKEYSRSSADQDVPLPHELRPPAVLKMSMDHILCNIIDRVENMSGTMADWYSQVQGRLTSFTSYQSTNENVGDWFEYVWSMTRAIRKDITQQDLKDPITVDLVEKCARFHIVCAERLIEEDSSRFDRKLNDENLTKCIQTLKHMYEDLRHHDISCPNEPEFRTYGVLLNLNDGDTLQSIETLPPWVRNSPEMRFALAVYSAINTNNYVKFFKLVRQSTLLQGCLLLRYFDQVRSEAMGTIVKAYVPVKQAVEFRLSKFCDLLGFESIGDCYVFCQLHNLNTDTGRDCVYLDKSSFQTMESVPDPKRPIELVENKRRGVPWSEIINNGPLPENPYLSYRPHDSFDGNGFLKRDALYASDQLKQMQPPQLSLMPPQQQHFQVIQPPRQELLLFTHPPPVRSDPTALYERDVFELASELLAEVVDQECSAVGRVVVNEETRFEAAGEVIQDLIDEEVEAMIQTVGADTLRLCKNEELQKRLEHEAKLNAMEELADEFVESVARDMAREVAVEEMKNVEKQLRLESLLSLASEIVIDLYDEVAEDEMKSLCRDSIRELHEERERKIVELQEKHRLKKERKVFDLWRKIARKQKKQRDTLNHFPSMPSRLTLDQQVEKFGQSPSGAALKSGSVAKHQKEVGLLLKAIDLEDNLLTKAILEKIRLDQIISEIRSDESNFVFKLILCLPSLNPDSPHRPFCEMLKKKFSTQAGDNLSENVLRCDISTTNGRHVEVCVRNVTSQTIEEEIATNEKLRRSYLFGTSAILFLHLDEDDEDSGAYERLNSLVDNLPRDPPVPVHILTTFSGKDSASFLENTFDLQRLRYSGKIDKYETTNLTTNIFDLSSVVSVHKSVEWLVKNCPASTKPPGLVCKSITNYVEDFVGTVFFQEVRANLEHRLSHSLPHQDPNVLIELYNSAVEHLELVCMQDGVSEISWPCPELHGDVLKRTQNVPSYWNEPAYLETVRSSLKSLRLPKMNAENVSTPQQVFMYFRSIEKSYVDATFCRSRLERSIKKVVEKRRKSDAGDFDLPWTDIVETCIEYKLKALDTLDQFSSDHTEMKVVYFEDHLNQFFAPKVWTSSLGWKPEKETSFAMKQLNRSAAEESRRIRSSLSLIENPSNLTVMVQDEKSQSDAFENALKQALEGTHSHGSQFQHRPNVETSPVVAETFYVPVISWLSPALASRATSKSIKQRVTVVTHAGDDDGHETSQRRQSLPTAYVTEKYRHSKSGVVNELKNRVQADLDESFMFENRLQAALQIDQ